MKFKDYYEANKAKWYTPASAKISLITLKTGRTATLDENRKLAKEIVAKFNAMDIRCDYHVRCPECGELQKMEFESIDFAGERVEIAHPVTAV